VRVIETSQEIINQLFQDGNIPANLDENYKFFQNEFVVLKGSSTALTRCIGNELYPLKIEKKHSISGVNPRNKEQQMAFDILLDDRVKVIVLTGTAGTGKTLLALATALYLIEAKDNAYKRIILTRPMSWVGKHGLGALPGEVNEKFGPYLENYVCNIAHLLGGDKDKVSDAINQYHMEFIPLQLIRGASWANSIIIADEVQILDYQEMVALGTRVGEGSKIVIMGDLGQRDEKIAREKTGIHKFINDEKAKNSKIVASLELLKCERSCVATLFAEIFGV
jgi:PhoH-like ATPase